jgi:hypothetical protein
MASIPPIILVVNTSSRETVSNRSSQRLNILGQMVMVERFNLTLLEEFYQVAFRKKVYHSLEELQRDLDEFLYMSITLREPIRGVLSVKVFTL